MFDVLPAVDLQADLQAIDDHIRFKLKARSALINAAGEHLLGSGGKRMRATLAVLAARLGPRFTTASVLHAAAAVELIHAASLVHDDLIDDADTRRGRTTVHAKWNGNVAIMLGDYLFAMAAGEMALAPDARVIAIFADAVQRICEAELAPVLDVEPTDVALDQYYRKIGGKTAALFEAAATAGMVCGGGSERDLVALGQFGYDVGLAFQIIDDVLDFTGTEAVLGKPAGHDLAEGTITLPLIYAVSSGGGAVLHDVAHIDHPDQALIAAAVAEVKRVGGTDQALREAERLITQAVTRLDQFADTPVKTSLIELAQHTIRRRM